MTYPKRQLEIVPEGNDENDAPACWAITICTTQDGKRHFLWISKYDDNEYIIEDSNGRNLAEKTYKTLAGAKRKAEEIAYMQENKGIFTN